MREIVINTCYGGFGLSHKGVMRYAELKGLKLYPWVDDIVKKVYGADVSLDDALLVHYTTVPQEEYETIRAEESKKPIIVDRFEKSNKLYFSGRGIPRDDPDLIKVIKELGKEANGKHAELKVVKIPNKVEFTIEEYDGVEWIAEKHRGWE